MLLLVKNTPPGGSAIDTKPVFETRARALNARFRHHGAVDVLQHALAQMGHIALLARGYASIGCLPCTTRVTPDEDPRAGRWRGNNKNECGIHFANAKLIRRKDVT